MQGKLDQLLLMLLGAGWSEKKTLDAFDEVRENANKDVGKRFRTLRKAVHEPGSGRTSRKSQAPPVDRALKALRSAGPYTENEILHFLRLTAARDTGVAGTANKGGLRHWLLDLENKVGSERMLEVVTAVRNDLVHNPRPGWSITDLR